MNYWIKYLTKRRMGCLRATRSFPLTLSCDLWSQTSLHSKELKSKTILCSSFFAVVSEQKTFHKRRIFPFFRCHVGAVLRFVAGKRPSEPRVEAAHHPTDGFSLNQPGPKTGTNGEGRGRENDAPQKLSISYVKTAQFFRFGKQSSSDG